MPRVGIWLLDFREICWPPLHKHATHYTRYFYFCVVEQRQTRQRLGPKKLVSYRKTCTSVATCSQKPNTSRTFNNNLCDGHAGSGNAALILLTSTRHSFPRQVQNNLPIWTKTTSLKSGQCAQYNSALTDRDQCELQVFTPLTSSLDPFVNCMDSFTAVVTKQRIAVRTCND